LYEKIGIIVDKQDPVELAMLYAVNKAQLELRKLDSISERRMGIVGCVRGLGRPNRARYAAMEG